MTIQLFNVFLRATVLQVYDPTSTLLRASTDILIPVDCHSSMVPVLVWILPNQLGFFHIICFFDFKRRFDKHFHRFPTYLFLCPLFFLRLSLLAFRFLAGKLLISEIGIHACHYFLLYNLLSSYIATTN